MKVSVNVILFILLLTCFSSYSGEAQNVLSSSEVNALRKIGTKLKKDDWDFSVDPCTGLNGWNENVTDIIVKSVSCNCTSSVCHVTNLLLKNLNLSGTLPEEISDLPWLQEIDLSKNYLNGSIPARWGTLSRLTSLSLLGNRISGSFPKEIGNITTLRSIVLESNSLTGSLPPELGNLSSLERLLLSSNNFSGELPIEMRKLTKLKDFRIDGTSISGRIPDFIQHWKELSRLDMQGTAMQGPIPSIISLLTKLINLRITDLNGTGSGIPNLQNATNMTILILRNCMLSGPIPSYIGNMSNLKSLDLSFNQLSGEIPSNFQELTKLDSMFLTNNTLTGTIPGWILKSKNNIDLSYNNFTGPSQSNCGQTNLNFVSSYSSSAAEKFCLKRNLPCAGKAQYYSLFINCGGPQIEVNGRVYEDNSLPLGRSVFFLSSNERWAFTSTGDFVGNDKADFVTKNISFLNITNPGLYSTARLSPLSLNYYGLCLREGNYTVKLHFAEIMFTNDQTFSSTGKRIFDVSIQGQKVLKNFNIMESAGGVEKDLVMTFTALVNTTNTLEIHLYWAGKGTPLVPQRGVYGPLISAITVTPNFDVGEGSGLSVVAIVGIVAACCVGLILILLILWWRGCIGNRYQEDKELRRELEMQTGYFSLKQIKAATKDFDQSNKIGEGGFGPVYKGTLPDGSVIAVKQLSSKSKQGNREFINEIGMISALQHPNLVKLYGCCIEGNQLLLIYEYLENNSLARAIFGQEKQRLHLDWATRCKICLGIAKGLAYLHEESRLKIVHRDIKATNVLLDKDLNAKISDFGLAKLDEEENTHISTRIAGTIGYMAPEYAMRGYLTDKADVYSFGVVLLEVVSGKSNTSNKPREEFVYLLDWAYVLQEQGNLLELVDSRLGSSYSKEEALRMLNIALLCTNPSPSLRPAMSAVVSMLDGRQVAVPNIKGSSTVNDEFRLKAFEILSHDSHSQTQVSTDGPWIDSSVSIASKEDSAFNSSNDKLLS